MKATLQRLGDIASDLLKKSIIKAVSLGETLGQTLAMIGNILKFSLDHALTNARTELYNSFREGFIEQIQATAQENNVTGWIWRAEHDVRTCIVCLSLDGSKHSIDEAMQSHFNCRCQMEIFTNNGSLNNDGVSWFEDRSKDEQRDILGKGKYEAWVNGDIEITDLVGRDADGYYYEKPLKDILKSEDVS